MMAPMAALALSAVALAAAGLTLLRLCHVVALRRAAERLAAVGQEAALAALQDSLNVLTARVEELELRPTAPLPPAAPKPGFNLGKRSQALRMHRRGDSPEQIAAALEISRQEVELLLKVHRIVLSSF